MKTPAAKMVTQDPTDSTFREFFEQGTCFWTSEDGCRSDLVILRNPSVEDEHAEEKRALVELFKAYHYVKGLDWSKHLIAGFVHEAIVEGWHDGPLMAGERRPRERPVWTFSDKPTAFPVWVLSI